MKGLLFKDVDDLALAAEMGCLPIADHAIFLISALGPYMELMSVALRYRDATEAIASYIGASELTDLRQALSSGIGAWVRPSYRDVGFFRCGEVMDHTDPTRTAFYASAEAAAVNSGFPRKVAQQFIAGIIEMEDNVHRHSGMPTSGVVVFRAAAGEFEFVVRDVGMGPLESFNSTGVVGHLDDHGVALVQMLTEGVSRLGLGNGFGFRQVFVGLANLEAELRFRSGDHSLSLLGRSPRPDNAVAAQQATVDGLILSVDARC